MLIMSTLRETTVTVFQPQNNKQTYLTRLSLEWNEHSYETTVETLTDSDKLIATNKGWTLA